MFLDRSREPWSWILQAGLPPGRMCGHAETGKSLGTGTSELQGPCDRVGSGPCRQRDFSLTRELDRLREVARAGVVHGHGPGLPAHAGRWERAKPHVPETV